MYLSDKLSTFFIFTFQADKKSFFFTQVKAPNVYK